MFGNKTALDYTVTKGSTTQASERRGTNVSCRKGRLDGTDGVRQADISDKFNTFK
jgi:hypothetical protein